MGTEILTFDNIEIKKNKFYGHETPIPFRKSRYWKSISI